MSVVIEFCESNLSSGTNWVLERLQEDPELDIEIFEYGCLGHCEQCFLHPYALVAGEMVIAETPEELLILVKEQVCKKQAEEEQWRKLGF